MSFFGNNNNGSSSSQANGQSASANLQPNQTQSLSVFEDTPDTKFFKNEENFILPVPFVDEDYRCNALQPPTRRHSTQPLLLILDLNGTLLFRPKTQKGPGRATAYRPRHYLQALFDWIFDPANNFRVMIWTSMEPDNVTQIVLSLLSPGHRRQLVTTWDRNHFNLNRQQYRNKTQLYKRLEWVWENELIQQSHPMNGQGMRWGAHNTVLIDDSPTKAAAQPFNHIHIPEFVGVDREVEYKQGSVLEQVAGYLEELRNQHDVSRFIQLRKFATDAGWFKPLTATNGNPHPTIEEFIMEDISFFRSWFYPPTQGFTASLTYA